MAGTDPQRVGSTKVTIGDEVTYLPQPEHSIDENGDDDHSRDVVVATNSGLRGCSVQRTVTPTSVVGKPPDRPSGHLVDKSRCSLNAIIVATATVETT